GRGGSVVRGGNAVRVRGGSAVRGGWRGGRGGSVVRGGIVGSLSRGWGDVRRRVVRGERRGGDDTPFDPNLEEEPSSETYSADDSEEEEECSSSKIHRGVKAKGKAKMVKPKSMIKDINPIVYTDNSKSVGGRLKEVGKVIETFQQYEKISMNVNCPLEIFGRVLGKFDETKTRIVKDMGFGTLFYAVGKRLPRQLAYWLCTQVDVDKKCLRRTDGMVYPFSSIQVHWVLGLPHGRRPVPTKVVDQEVEDNLWIKYHTIYNSGTEGITRKTLIEALEASCTDEDEFRQLFVLLMLNTLCSTTYHRMKKKHLHTAAVASSAKLYNCCSLILDELLHAMASFAKRIPLEWNEFPRLKVWTTKEMSKACKEDRFPTGDFGKKGCLDVSYSGDAGHPLKAKDCFTAKRKREEADEVVADIDDEDLAWITIDVKTRRTLVKEEYAFQRKKKKLGEEEMEEESKKGKEEKENDNEHELEKDLEKKPEKEHELEKELEKEPEKEVGPQKEHEKQLGLEKESDQKELEKEAKKEAEKESEKEPKLEKELEKEPSTDQPSHVMNIESTSDKSELDQSFIDAIVKNFGVDHSLVDAPLSSTGSQFSESKYLVGSHEADAVGGASAFNVPKGEGDVEGGVHKGEGDENKDVPTSEEELPKLSEAKASEGVADATKGIDNVIPKSPEYCKDSATYDSEDESQTTNVQNKRHQLSRKQRKISEPLTLPVSYINQWRPKGIRCFRVPLRDYLDEHMSFSTRNIRNDENEPTFFSCDGDYVKLTLCGHLIHNFGEVNDQALPADWRDLLSHYSNAVRVKRGKTGRAWHVTLLGADVPSTRSLFFDEGWDTFVTDNAIVTGEILKV
uniref:TF-B3 domain-containing protein n=1 Tax=Chenopodium quinoa TaxID=63459 RepID=A0A803LM63_CHEQI